MAAPLGHPYRALDLAERQSDRYETAPVTARTNKRFVAVDDDARTVACVASLEQFVITHRLPPRPRDRRDDSAALTRTLPIASAASAVRLHVNLTMSLTPCRVERIVIDA
jgi:hypothetical protein